MVIPLKGSLWAQVFDRRQLSCDRRMNERRFLLNESSDVGNLYIWRRSWYFFHKHCDNIRPVQQFKNPTASAREFPISLQFCEEGSKFKTTRISVELMPLFFHGINLVILEFSEIDAFFLKSVKCHKLKPKVTPLVDLHVPWNKFSFIDKTILILIDIFHIFQMLWNFSPFHLKSTFTNYSPWT